MTTNLVIQTAFYGIITLPIRAFSLSVKVHRKGDDYNENGIVFERDICNIVSVFIPHGTTLHLHALPIILSNCHLHYVLVPLVFAEADQGLLGVGAELPCKRILPVLFVGLSLLSRAFLLAIARFGGVLLLGFFLLLRRLLGSCVALLVRSDQVWDQLLDGSSSFSWPEFLLKRWADLILCLGFSRKLLQIFHLLL